MDSEAWLTLAIVTLLIVGLVRNYSPDVLFCGATALLAVLGIITPQEAFVGFSNPGMLAVAALFVVASGLRDTGVLDYVGHHVLGGARTEKSVLIRLAGVVLPFSAFLNNTPIVSMFVPVVIGWGRRNNVSPSKLLIPLSFFAIFGGTCTLIGTSTNLVINGMIVQTGLRGLGMFEIAWIGIPYAIIGLLFMLFIGRHILPERKELLEQLGESRREYLAEMQVQAGCRLIGQTVENAGLRRLPGLFLIEIERKGHLIAPVGPDDTLQSEDRLVFTGVVSTIIELEKINGLVPISDPDYEVAPRVQQGRRLCEAVISENSPLVGKTVKAADFRATYGAAVVAVHRGGSRVERKVGDIVIRPGDTLLLQTRPHFLRAYRNDPAFYLISDVEEWRPLRPDRAWIAVLLFMVLVGLMTAGFPVEVVALLFAVLMVGVGCVSAGEARNSIEWQSLITIAAAFGVGQALDNSGLANLMATTLVDSTRFLGPLAAVAVFYLLGSLMTELITNNAAAVLLFPFCLETARQYDDASPYPFLMALILAASASFMTPIGYQTNMMVYGPGGYRFMDFVRVGAPLNFILWLVAVALIPVFWPFHP
ncbi:MAG: SLC13 family permease [Pirellulaceae bacterium]